MRTSLIPINPVQNLDLVRSIFFPVPGATLGSGTLHTISQADAYDPAHPEDAAYVENVIWKQKLRFRHAQHPGRLEQRHRPLVRRTVDERSAGCGDPAAHSR